MLKINKDIDRQTSTVVIGRSAFEGWDDDYEGEGPTTILLGSGVTSIANTAFYRQHYLTSITIRATTPPTLESVFALSDTNNCPIYVPAESVELYRTATNWSAYASRIQAEVV